MMNRYISNKLHDTPYHHIWEYHFPLWKMIFPYKEFFFFFFFQKTFENPYTYWVF
jgi:hypothetical protein